MLELFLFGVLATATLIGGGMIIMATRPATHAMGFLIALLSVGGLFALLHQSFLFFGQIMVTVGGVVIVTLIMILTVNLKEEQLPQEPFKYRWLLGTAVLISPFSWLLYRTLTSLGGMFPPVADAFGSTVSVGEGLFHGGVLPFEVLSVLLLAAMVGAIIIGNKEQSYDRKS